MAGEGWCRRGRWACQARKPGSGHRECCTMAWPALNTTRLRAADGLRANAELAMPSRVDRRGAGHLVAWCGKRGSGGLLHTADSLTPLWADVMDRGDRLTWAPQSQAGTPVHTVPGNRQCFDTPPRAGPFTWRRAMRTLWALKLPRRVPRHDQSARASPSRCPNADLLSIRNTAKIWIRW
jgi:hypothetical protein